MTIRKTHEQFMIDVSNVKALYGKNYQHPERYITSKTKMRVVCPIHGDFFITPNSLLSGNGCNKCRIDNLKKLMFLRRLTKEEFVKRAKNHLAHIDRNYMYDDTNYTIKKGICEIGCPLHGPFMVSPDSHLQGTGCPGCMRATYNKNKEYIICNKCGTEKHKSCYIKSRWDCKECQKQHRKDNAKENRERGFIYRLNHKEMEMFKGAKSRAKERGLEFNITIDDIFIPEKCPVLGIPIYKNSRGCLSVNSPTLDRIDNSMGYIKGNVMVISHKANQIKSNGSIEDHLRVIEYMKLNLPSDVSVSANSGSYP